MKAHTEYPALETLAKLVHEQRRKVAGELRINREKHELQGQMDKLLEAAGVDAVTCELPLGTFEVRRAVARNGQRFASVTPITTEG